MRCPFAPVVALLGMALGSTLAPPAARAADSPKVWSVVIGINKYEDALIPRCTGSGRDAKAVADWLAETAGWGQAGVLRIDDLGKRAHGPASATGAPPELFPSRENLEWAVSGWLGERVRPGDVVVIYFAGQSASRAPRPGAAAGRAYLLPIDARAADVDATGWSLDDALDRAGTAKKARVVIWLDTSLRGRGGPGLAPEPGAPSGLDWLGALSRWEGVTAWLAADGRPEPEDGSFVAALRGAMGKPTRPRNLVGGLDALRGEAALTARGFRTMGGVSPSLSLWFQAARVAARPDPELIVQAGHGHRVNSVLVTADNDQMITASEDSTVRIWKLGEGEPAVVRILTDPFIGVRALALDPEGKLLLAGDGAGGIFGWDLTEDRPRSIPGPAAHEQPIAGLAFLPEGLSFVSLDEAGRSILWDGAGGVLKKLRAFSDGAISRIAAAAHPEPAAPALVAAMVDPGPGGAPALRTFDARGALMDRIAGPGGRITALDLSADGRRLVVGDARGRVMVHDLKARSVALDRTFPGPIHLARLSKSGPMVVADDRTLRLVEPRTGGSDRALSDSQGVAAPGRVDRAKFSDDGRWLVACTPVGGRVLAWGLGDPAGPLAVTTPEDRSQGLSPAFSPDGRSLIVGDVDGGIRAWSMVEAAGGPRAEPRARVKAARGQVAALSPSRTGRFLLQITRDDLALLWDLEQGRGCRPLPGTWSSAAFLPGDSRLVLTRRGGPGSGEVVLFDLATNAPLPTLFDRPVDGGHRPVKAAFGRVVVSKSGKLVAAAADDAQLPLACVWETETGKLLHTARIHAGGLTALDFSADEAHLLTASDDGTAKFWRLADPSVEFRRAAATFINPENADPALTAATVCPTDPRRVATGSRGGLVLLWDWDKPKDKVEHLGDPIRLAGAVNALAFSADGRWLAASSMAEKRIRFLDLSGGGEPRVAEFRPKLHHTEQVGALAAWPVGSMILSGGDDSAVRFWDLGDRALIGTLIAQVRNPEAVDWLAYAPNGLFDGSMPGEAMVKWRVGGKVLTLQQTEDTHHAFRLASAIARGEKPRLEPRSAPELKAEGPSLKIFAPPTGSGIGPREVELTLWSDSPNPDALRLYQNGVPIRGVGDFRPGETPHFARTRVQLRRGENRLYAMASRPGSADGKSDELVLRYDGAETPGRLHTVALGISNYPNRALKYAHVDARGIADFLRRQGLQGADQPGERIVLVDDQVNPARIDDAFRRVAEAVQGRPEDTVVLFLAGHTDTDEVADQFCLLLPGFPFPAAPAPGRVVNQDVPGVAVRGAPVGGGVRVGDAHVLPYSVLYNRLARLEALQRLVIVDACQAGAILDDPAVARIRKNVERGSRKSRNSYLLAARRGEPATEADALRHGLLTYTLLHGMGADDLKPIPDDLGGFPGPASADLDRNGFVSSDELVAYADEALPPLARIFPQVVLRAGGPIPGPDRDQPPPELEQKLRIQSGGASFPLIVHPAGPR